MYEYAKMHILTDHALPFWNNIIFSGMPLLPDPQSPLFYPPNLLFLFLPTDKTFILSFIIHTLLGGIGAYLVAKKALNLYLASPRLAGYLEAGHVGLVYSWAWLPFILLALFKIRESKNIRWVILLAVSLAGVFFTHTTTFLIAFSSSTITFFGILLLNKQKTIKASILRFTIGLILCLGLISVTFIPQLVWASNTSRVFLLQNRDVYPKWNSIIEIIQSLFPPLFQAEQLQKIDTEKWIYLGIIPLALALWGFLAISKKAKSDEEKIDDLMQANPRSEVGVEE